MQSSSAAPESPALSESGITRSMRTPPSGGRILPEPLRPRKPTKRRPGLSIYQKLLGVMLLLVTGIIALLAGYLPSRQIKDMQVALEGKAHTYARLVAKQVESAIAFNDQETAREVFESVAQDTDVASVTLFTQKGSVLRSLGSMTRELEAKKSGVPALESVVSAERISVIAPVTSLEGPRGTLVLELSMKKLTERRQEVLREAAMAGLVALILGGIGAWSIANSLGKRLRNIAQVANAVAEGDLEQKPVDSGNANDEIGVVVAAFDSMLKQIRNLVSHIKQTALQEQERLETLVRKRTVELDGRNADMRRVLDNVEQGFLTLDRAGIMSVERSRVLERWFDKAPESQVFWEYFAQAAPEFGVWFQLGWETVIEDVLPLSVSLDQLPKRLRAKGRELEIAYRPILSERGDLDRLLVVASDITAELERVRAEADEREVTRLFSKVISDRAGFLDFFSEAHNLLEGIAQYQASAERELLQRALHTFKGNTALYGVESVASMCHELENKLVESANLEKHDIYPLQERWNNLSGKIRALIGDGRDRIEIDDREYALILDAIEKGQPRDEIRRMILAWRLEPAAVRLARVGEQAVALAKRLGKGPIEVRVESNEIRLEPEQWSEFWAATTHVLRNSIDHGLETAEERASLGKSHLPALELRTRLSEENFSIEFSDSGRGINWGLVADKARKLGIKANTRAELTEALFTDGLSTRDEVTENSGRGVGLAAVRQACQKLGGYVEIESKLGIGTTFRFVWPAAILRGNSNPVGAAVDTPPISMSVGLRWASLPPPAE